LLEQQTIGIFKHDEYTHETIQSNGILYPTKSIEGGREKRFARDVQHYYYVVRFLCSDHTKHKSWTNVCVTSVHYLWYSAGQKSSTSI